MLFHSNFRLVFAAVGRSSSSSSTSTSLFPIYCSLLEVNFIYIVIRSAFISVRLVLFSQSLFLPFFSLSSLALSPVPTHTFCLPSRAIPFTMRNAIAESRIDAKWWKLSQSAHSPISTLMEGNTVWQTYINSLYFFAFFARSHSLGSYNSRNVYLCVHLRKTRACERTLTQPHTVCDIHNFILIIE